MNVRNFFFKIIIFFLLLLSLGQISCTSGALSRRLLYSPRESVERLVSGNSIEKEIEFLALPVINSGEAVGVSIGILYPDGMMNFYGYGKTDNAENGIIPSGDTIFEVGSLSKLFVLSVYSSMLNDGIISENTTVRDILPENIKLKDDIASVTMKELANHTAGFPREIWSFEQLSCFIKYVFTGENLYSYMDKNWLYEFLQTVELPPREQRTYIYSNLGISLLAHLLEIKSGKPYYQLAEEIVFKPLGMKDTFYKITEVQRKRLARGHAGDQPKFMLRGTSLTDWDMGDFMYPTGACYSTTRDLLIFSMANLGITDTPLKKILLDMQKFRVSTSEEKFALGWSIDNCGIDDMTILYKHGMVSGYSAYIGFNPDTKIAVVTLYNSFNWNEKIAHNLLIRLSSYAIHSGSRKNNIANKIKDTSKVSGIE